jgi:glycosyltransferase involved in cell wall biosynthesis
MLAHADEVWVLTRANNKEVIEANPLSHASGLHFLYYDLPRWSQTLKKHAWFLSIYFTLWQWGAYRLAARHHGRPFDAVYHVTFASMQFGSFMGRLKIPFIVGPIAGGERAPLRLRRGMPLAGKTEELLRDLRILCQRLNPLSRPSLSAAERIYVATSESLRLIPPKWRAKTSICLAIAAQVNAEHIAHQYIQETPRFVYAGNLRYMKGVHFAIRAMAKVILAFPNATLTLFGDGPAEEWLRKVAQQWGVSHAVIFAGRVPRQLLIHSFPGYTALVFPSLHDSGGMAVLEAFSAGLPAVCLDLGGPGVIVNESCGYLIPSQFADEMQIVSHIADAMISMGYNSPAAQEHLSLGAIARAKELSWTNLTSRVVGQ